MRIFLLALLLALPLTGLAEPLQVGSQLDAFSIEDQFGKSHAVDGSLRAILFTRDMDAGELVKAALSEEGSARLAGAGGSVSASARQWKPKCIEICHTRV